LRNRNLTIQWLNGSKYEAIREVKGYFSMVIPQIQNLVMLNSQVVAVVQNERYREVNSEFLIYEDPERTIWSPIERKVIVNGNKGHIGILYSLDAFRIRGIVECSLSCDVYLLDKESYQNVIVFILNL
jgi:hypothetical protein